MGVEVVTMQNGKGSTRRPGKPGAYERGYTRIKWKSQRKGKG